MPAPALRSSLPMFVANLVVIAFGIITQKESHPEEKLYSRDIIPTRILVWTRGVFNGSLLALRWRAQPSPEPLPSHDRNPARPLLNYRRVVPLDYCAASDSYRVRPGLARASH